MIGRRLLAYGETCEAAVGVEGEVGTQGVAACGLEPFLGPRGQIAAGLALELDHEISQGRVAPGVLVEIGAKARHEVVDADPGHELPEDRCTLGVGDAVEVRLHRLDVRGVGDDRVRRRQLVLAVAPGLAAGREARPGVGEPGGRGRRVVGHELGEGLVEPQVVPPAHGDEVAEPHVRHLVQDRVGAGVAHVVGDLAAEDEVVLVEGHAAGVLHGAGVELSDADLVVLRERVGATELALEELEALLGELEDLAGVEERSERGRQ